MPKTINTYNVIIASKLWQISKADVYVPCKIMSFFKLKDAREKFNKLANEEIDSINKSGRKVEQGKIQPIFLDYNNTKINGYTSVMKGKKLIGNSLGRSIRYFYIFLIKVEVPFAYFLNSPFKNYVIYNDYFETPISNHSYIIDSISELIDDDDDEYLVISNIQFGYISNDYYTDLIRKAIVDMYKEGNEFNKRIDMPKVKITIIK